MADSVLFDGTDDTLTVTIGNMAFAPGDLTVVVIAKQTADSVAQKHLLYCGSSAAGANRWGFYHHTTGGLMGFHLGDNAQTAPTASWDDAGGWVLGAFSRGVGTTTPRFHRYSWDGATWLHENAAGTLVDGTTPGGTCWFSFNSVGNFWNGSILIGGAVNANLSDGTIETLKNGRQAWYDAGFREALRLNSLGQIVSDTGCQSYETARVGTTLDTGDVPAGWDDTLVKRAGPSFESRMHKFPIPPLRMAA